MFDRIAVVLGSSFERAPWGWMVLALLVSAFVKLRPVMTKIAAERESSLLAARAQDNEDLKHRVDKLENMLETQRRSHEAERRIDRHRINNLTQCLDALLLLLETAPERAAEHVVRIKEMRARQAQAEAAEKGAVSAASIQAVTP